MRNYLKALIGILIHESSMTLGYCLSDDFLLEMTLQTGKIPEDV